MSRSHSTVEEPENPFGLSDDELRRLNGELNNQPPENETPFRPQFGGLLGGITKCIYDEIKGIWDLIKLLYEISQDIDVAADGVDDWEIFRSHSYDIARVIRIYDLLASGGIQFGSLPQTQQTALFRLYAKLEIAKKILHDMGQMGLELVAAYDVHFNPTYDWLSPFSSENAIKALADAISLFYEDDEWAAMADAGQTYANNLLDNAEKRWEEKPWETLGYVLCLIALLFSPTKIIAALKPILATLKRLTRIGDIAALLRVHNIAPPAWLPRPKNSPLDEALSRDIDLDAPTSPADDVTPDLDINENIDLDPDPTPPRDPVDIDQDIEIEAKPTPPRDPSDIESPETTPNTTQLTPNQIRGLRSQVAGELAEQKALRDLGLEYDNVAELKTSGNRGLDGVGYNLDPVTGEITSLKVIEAKSRQPGGSAGTQSSLTNPQQAGGKDFTRNAVDEILATGPTHPQHALAKRIDRFLNGGGKPKYEVWKYEADTETGLTTKIGSTTWESGMNNSRGGIANGKFKMAEGDLSSPETLDVNQAIDNVQVANPNSAAKYDQLRPR